MKKIILITILAVLALPIIVFANGDDDHQGMMGNWSMMGAGWGWFSWIFMILLLIILVLIIFVLVKWLIDHSKRK